MSEIGAWLGAIGLAHYAATFDAQRIGFDILAELGDADFDALGVALGDRKRLRLAIAARNAAATQPAGDVERRQLSVLFVDLSGYTRMTNTLGAEAVHRIVQAFYARVATLVADFGGSVERHIGDAVMAVFGLPLAHHDDAERALRAALAIHAAMPALGAQLGQPLSVHAGVASGAVVARHGGAEGDFSTVGDAINLGARLAALAAPGETVCSDAVRRAAEQVCDAESIGEVAVKGFDKPLRAWRVGRLRERGAAPGAALVGRRVEIRQFRALCEACRDEHAGQLVIVRGDAGIGKSRLIEEFEAEAGGLGFACHKGLTLDFGAGRGQAPMARIIAGVLALAAGAGDVPPETALQAAQAAGWIEGDEAMYAAEWLALPVPDALRAVHEGIDPQTRLRQQRQFVIRLLRRAAERQPRLVVVEDVHWADAALLELLGELASALSGQRLLLVLSTRVDGDPLDSRWRALCAPHVGALTLDLRPLRDDEALTLARTLADDAGDLLGECVRRAEGNPLFLEQLLRSALAGDAEALPGTVQSLVLSRLDRLAPRDRHAIAAASVLGQRFSTPLLRALIDDPGYDAAALLAANLVRPLGGEMLFAHALVWEATYAALLDERKSHWHCAAAALFDANDPALAAEHLDRAGDAGAARAYLRAARSDHALQQGQRAVQLLGRGLQLARDDSERVELLAELGDALPAAGRAHDALGVFEQLLSLAGDARQRCRALIGSATALRMLDRQPQALDALQQAQALADASFDAELAQIHYLRGSVYFPQGNVDGCLQQHSLALQHARRAGSMAWQLRALSGLGDAHYAAGRVVSAHDSFRECVRLVREHRHGQIEAANLPMVAVTAILLGRIDEALAETDAALQLARRLANPRAQMIAHHAGAMANLERGDAAQALPHAQAALELSHSIGARRFDPEAMLFVAACRLLQGERDAALALLRDALQLAREHISFCGPMILGTLALASSDAAERRRCLDEGEAIVAAGAPAHNHLFFYRDAIDAALGDGDTTAALRYAGLLESRFAAEPFDFASFIVARARALGAAAEGRRDAELRARIERLCEQADAAQYRPMEAALRAAR